MTSLPNDWNAGIYSTLQVSAKSYNFHSDNTRQWLSFFFFVINEIAFSLGGGRDLPIKMLKGHCQCHPSSSALHQFKHRNNGEITVLLFARWEYKVCPCMQKHEKTPAADFIWQLQKIQIIERLLMTAYLCKITILNILSQQKTTFAPSKINFSSNSSMEVFANSIWQFLK